MSLAGPPATCEPHDVDGGLPPIVAPTLGGFTAIAGDAVANHDFYAGTLELRRMKCGHTPPAIVRYLAPGARFDTELNFITCHGAIPGRPGAGMAHRLVWTTPTRRAFRDWRSRLIHSGCGLEERDGALHFCDPDGLRHELRVIPDPAATSDERASRLRAVRIYSDDRQATTRGLANIVRGDDGSAPPAAGSLGGLIVDDAPPIPGRLGAGSIHHVIWKLTTATPRPGPAQILRSPDLHLVGSDQCAEHRRLYARGPGGLLLALDAYSLGAL